MTADGRWPVTTPGEIGASQSTPNPQPVGGNDRIDWRKEADALAASLGEVARGGNYIQAQAALARYEDAVRASVARPKTRVHFQGGPWARQTYEVETVVGPVFAAGHSIGNHYWLDSKSDPPTYVWDGTEWEFDRTHSGRRPSIPDGDAE